MDKRKKRLVRCNVLSCTNSNRTKRDDLFLYMFPKDPLKRSVWCRAVGFPESKVHTGCRVCSDHFREEDFQPSFAEQVPELNLKRQRRLLTEAVPSLRLPDPEAAAAAVGDDDGVSKKKKAKKGRAGARRRRERLETDREEEDVDDNDCSNDYSPSPTKTRRIEGRTVRKQHLMSPEPCLVCSKKDSKGDPNPDLYEFTGSNGYSPLNRQLWHIFLLRKLLRLPASKFEDILRKIGSSINPSDWYFVCGACTRTVNTILDLQEQIKMLELKVTRLKKSVEKTFQEEGCDGRSRASGSNHVFSIRNEIRTFLKGARDEQSSIAKQERENSDAESESNPSHVEKPDFGATIVAHSASPGADPYDSDSNGNWKEKGDEEWLPNPDASSGQGETPITEEPDAEPISDNASDGESEDDFVPDLSKRKTKKLLKSSKKKWRGHNVGGEFQCEICLRTYSTEGSYGKHMTFHARSKAQHNGVYDCFKCKAPYESKKSLQLHFRTEHCMRLHDSWDPSLPQEDYSFTRFTKKKVLAKLIAENKIAPEEDEEKGRFECTLCLRKFQTQRGFDKHAREHDFSKTVYDGRLDCYQCKGPFTKVTALRGHLKFLHGLILDEKWDGSTPQEYSLKNEKTGKPLISEDSDDESGKETHKCSRCDAEFTRKVGLEEHMKVHESTSDSLHCPQCHRPYPSEEALTRHLGSVHDIHPSYKCDICGYDAGKPKMLKLHILDHKLFDGSVDPSISTTHFVCTVCKELFKSRRVLRIHRVNFHAEELGLDVVKCTEENCTKVFLRKLCLAEHIAEKHKGALKFQCEQCGFGALTRHRLNLHMEKHDKMEHICEYCSAVYQQRHILKDHILKYHPEKYNPQKSYFHGVKVQRLENEYGHGELPMGTTGVPEPAREYPCKYCPDSISFPNKLGLKYHLKITHKDMFSFNCDLCDNVYMSEQSLKLHKKINHAGNTAVTCGWCRKKVSHRIKLYDHKVYCKKRPEGPNVPKILVLEDNPHLMNVDESQQCSEESEDKA